MFPDMYASGAFETRTENGESAYLDEEELFFFANLRSLVRAGLDSFLEKPREG